jgi:signal transduction histidine kinase
VSSGVVGVVNDSPLVALVVPVTRPDGTFGGLVGAGIRLDNLSVGADSLRYAGGADIVVIDANGMVIAGPAPVTELKATDPAFPVAELREAGQGAREVQVGPLGEADQLLGHAVAEQTGWLVLVERSAAGAFGAVNRAFIAALLAILGGAALSIGLLVWAARRLDVAVREQSRAYAHEQLARRQLEEAVTRLKERATLRDAFVGVMSHELRTPVTTIYGAAKLLAKAPHRDDLETLVEDIDEEATRLLRITEDLLVLARAEHGTIEIEREPILVQRIVPRVVADVRSRYPAMEITVEVGEEPPAAGDPGAVHQVLNNLLVNAVKYAAGAPIRVRTTSADGRVGFIVEDEGPGLPPADLPHVFQLFFRSQQNANRTAGTGIGLFVVQQLVEAMGGSVRAYRREPRGLGFEVLLPAYDAGR